MRKNPDASMALPSCSSWKRRSLSPPTEPGVYRLRFKAAPGIDQTPIDVELHEDTINLGGLAVQDIRGPWHRLQALYPVSSVEWWRETV